MKTIFEINKQLDELFKYWKFKSKYLGDTEAFVSDGIMRNTENDFSWHEKPIRIAFLVKDNPDGEQDTRDWLQFKKNQNLSFTFIHKIANLFYGLSKATVANDASWWFGEIEQHQEDVKDFFNTEPFAFIECKKQPGKQNIDDKVLQKYLITYQNLLYEELEIIEPNILVCMGQPIFDFVKKMYDDAILGADKNIYYVPSNKKIIIYAGHPSSRDSYENNYEGVMHWYRQFLKSDMYKDFNK